MLRCTAIYQFRLVVFAWSKGRVRPKGAVEISRQLSFSKTRVFRAGLPRSCRWRPHPTGHNQPVRCSSKPTLKGLLRSETCRIAYSCSSAFAAVGRLPGVGRQCGGKPPVNANQARRSATYSVELALSTQLRHSIYLDSIGS